MSHERSFNRNNPAITVIIPVFNRKQYLERALISIQEQSLNKNLFETIVIKNFIDDKLDLKIASFGYKNMFFEGNMGGRLFTAINESKGDIISFLQDDDLFVKDKLEIIYKILSENVGICFVSNGYIEIDENGLDIDSVKKKHDLEQVLFSENEKKEFSNICYMIKNGYDFNLSSISIRKDALSPYLYELNKINGSDDSFFFFVSLFASGSLIRLNVPLTKYRVHNSATAKSGSMNDVLRANYLTFTRQIATFSILKNLSQANTFSTILEEGIISRRVAIDICSPYRSTIKDSVINILFLISHHHSIKKKYIVKLILEYITTIISKEVGKRLYYYYNQKKYMRIGGRTNEKY